MSTHTDTTSKHPTEASTPAASTTTQLLDAALSYAAAGIPVLPLHTPTGPQVCSCRAPRDCGSPGKHPRLRHGLHDASTETALIRGWWQRWPDANIGLATGTVLDVCDIDTSTALAAVLELLDVIRPDGPLISTGNGWHLWYAAGNLPNRVGLLPGVDWRGNGGMVVAPPSAHVSGRRYRFQQAWTGAPLPVCPPQLRALVEPDPPPADGATSGIIHLDRYTRAALDGELQRIARAPRPVVHGGQRLAAGGRNNALHLAAFRLGQLATRGGLDDAEVRQELIDAAMQVGLSRAEAHRTVNSGWRAGRQRPR